MPIAKVPLSHWRLKVSAMRLSFFRRAADGRNPGVAARSFAKVAEIDSEHADLYHRNAVASEQKASGAGSPRVAVLLHQYALELPARRRDPESEPLLRRGDPSSCPFHESQRIPRRQGFRTFTPWIGLM
jgi:hypothetical protein